MKLTTKDFKAAIKQDGNLAWCSNKLGYVLRQVEGESRLTEEQRAKLTDWAYDKFTGWPVYTP